MTEPTSSAVLIPYFQREPGILVRCLRSVFAQSSGAPTHIIVVDDASPVSAADEIRQLLPAQAAAVTVLRRANGGPGAARNTGLDHLARDPVRYVLFLDSDDTWVADHVERVLATLEQGFDFFCGNYIDLDGGPDWYSARGHLLAGHRALPAPVGSYALHGPAADLVACNRPAPTMMSTIAYRFERFPDLRFPTDLRAAEDKFFWLALAERGARFAFSTGLSSRAGRGVNVYRSTDWGTAAHLGGRLDTLSFRMTAERSGLMSAAAAAEIHATNLRLRHEIARELVSVVARGRGLPTSAWRTTVRRHADLAFKLPLDFVRAAGRAILRRREKAAGEQP